MTIFARSLLALTFVVAIALIGCGGDDDATASAPSPTPTPTSAVTATPTEPPGDSTDTPTVEPSPTDTASETPTETPSIEPSLPPADTPTPTPGEEPGVLVTTTPPAGYPADLFPILEGALVTGATKSGLGGQQSYSLLFIVTDLDVDTILDFYQQAIEDAGWNVDFSQKQDETTGGVLGSKGDNAAEGSFILNIENSKEVVPALAVSLFLTLPTEQ